MIMGLDIKSFISRLLQGLDELNIPKPLRDDHGGGFKEFYI